MIYADNAATTKMSGAAMNAMLNCMEETWGNPSSLYGLGQRAKDALEEARERLAACIGASPKEITFTSGGSEADNQAIRSAALLGARKGKQHIISTTFEHHAVLHTLKKLEGEGFEVELLPVGTLGTVTARQAAEAIREDTALVTIMYANNEIGTIQDLKAISEIAHAHGAVFHTDAVQAVGHMPIDVQAMGIDLLSLSAHKFRGPKGVGALYCRRGVPLLTFVEGGAQERGKRAGTENLAGIAGMTAALEEACANMEKNSAKLLKLREKLIDGLLKIPHSKLNGDRHKRLPANVSMCFEGIEGESLLLLLDAKGICASSGSACTSGSLDPSHVLLALGLPHEVAHGSLRISLCEYNTQEDVEIILNEVPKVVAYLRNISPVWEELENGEKPHLI